MVRGGCTRSCSGACGGITVAEPIQANPVRPDYFLHPSRARAVLFYTATSAVGRRMYRSSIGTLSIARVAFDCTYYCCRIVVPRTKTCNNTMLIPFSVSCKKFNSVFIVRLCIFCLLRLSFLCRYYIFRVNRRRAMICLNEHYW